ncbi:MAG TPA: HEAT repeat domain-containing protein [Candidatus Limnocylindrales bacterium]|nr:HEAT repeat domain-containing protein [Candidatus Limnocylindrales bacterium]
MTNPVQRSNPWLQLRNQLKALHVEVGAPDLRALARRADEIASRAKRKTGDVEAVGEPDARRYGRKSAFGDLLDTSKKPALEPRWPTVEAFVDACECVRHGRTLGDEELDRLRRPWQEKWESVHDSDLIVPGTGRSLAAVQETYLRELFDRYKQVPNPWVPQIAGIGLMELFESPSLRAVAPPWDASCGGGSGHGLHPGSEGDQISHADTSPPQRDGGLVSWSPAAPEKAALELLSDTHATKVVILGDPGSGKSSLARYLAVSLASGTPGGPLRNLQGWVPILVELGAYAAWRRDRRSLTQGRGDRVPGGRVQHPARDTFADMFDDWRGRRRAALPKAALPRLMRVNKVVLIFDGFDEVFDPDIRRDIAEEIIMYAGNPHIEVRVVVTSRKIGYSKDNDVSTLFSSAEFQHHMLQDFTAAQGAAYVSRWYQLAYPGDRSTADRLAARLQRAVDEFPSIRDLSGNPLLLSILTDVGQRGDLPRDRVALYKAAVAALLRGWDLVEHLRQTEPALPKMNDDEKVLLLRLVARHLADTPAGLACDRIGREDLVAAFRDHLRAKWALPEGPAGRYAAHIIEQLHERNFILARNDDDTYSFVHRAFLDYFAADDIAARIPPPAQRRVGFHSRRATGDDWLTGFYRRHWDDPAWHEALVLLAQIRQDATGTIVAALLATGRGWLTRDEQPHHHMLVLRLLAELPDLAAVARHNTAIAKMIIWHLELNAVDWVGYFEVSFVGYEQLEPLLVRIGSRWAGRAQLKAWFDGQGRVLLDAGPYRATRAVAVFYPDESFRRGLADQAGGHLVPMARAGALAALAAGWNTHPDTVELLKRRAVSDEHWAPRCAAIDGLAEMAPDVPDALPLIRDRAANDASPQVRKAAVMALDRLRGTEPDFDTINLLRDAGLSDSDGAVRAMSASAFVRAHDPTWQMTAHWDILHWLAANDPDHRVRSHVVGVLAGQTANDSTRVMLDRARNDSSLYVRHAAVVALAGRERNTKDLKLLLELLSDAHADVRVAAADAISLWADDDPKKLAELFADAYRDYPEQVRDAAARAHDIGWAAERHERGGLSLAEARSQEEKPSPYFGEFDADFGWMKWKSQPNLVAVLNMLAGDDPETDLREYAPAQLPVAPSGRVRIRPADWWFHVRAAFANWEAHTRRPFTRLAVQAAFPDSSLRTRAVLMLAIAWRHRFMARLIVRMSAELEPDWEAREAAVEALLFGWRRHPRTLRTLRHLACGGTVTRRALVAAMNVISRRHRLGSHRYADKLAADMARGALAGGSGSRHEELDL